MNSEEARICNDTVMASLPRHSPGDTWEKHENPQPGLQVTQSNRGRVP